jgi:hypothetical protein
MLSLDSPRWSELEHAYGAASDIPSLLRQLTNGTNVILLPFDRTAS